MELLNRKSTILKKGYTKKNVAGDHLVKFLDKNPLINS